MDPNWAMLKYARERVVEAGVENVRFTKGAAANLGGVAAPDDGGAGPSTEWVPKRRSLGCSE